MLDISWSLVDFFNREAPVIVYRLPPYLVLSNYSISADDCGKNLDLLARFSQEQSDLLQTGNSLDKPTAQHVCDLNRIYLQVRRAVMRCEFDEEDIDLVRNLPPLMEEVLAHHAEKASLSQIRSYKEHDKKNHILQRLRRLIKDQNVEAFIDCYRKHKEEVQNKVISLADRRTMKIKEWGIREDLEKHREDALPFIFKSWGKPFDLQECEEAISKANHKILHHRVVMEAIQEFNQRLRGALNSHPTPVLAVVRSAGAPQDQSDDFHKAADASHNSGASGARLKLVPG